MPPPYHPTSIPLPILLYLETGSHQVAQLASVCGKLAAAALRCEPLLLLLTGRVSTSLDVLDTYATLIFRFQYSVKLSSLPVSPWYCPPFPALFCKV